MSKVYYRGKAFPYKIVGEIPGQRWYMLYENNVLRHFVEERKVEKRSVLKTIFDFYYRGVMYTMDGPVSAEMRK
jgi:hypothetical protein